MTKPAKVLFLALAAAVATIASIGAQERIEWEPVDGADHYRVEIRRDDELVLETRSDEAWLPLFLPAGDYRFRVKAINSFGKIASESEWSDVKISVIPVPFVIDSSPAEIHEGERPGYRIRVSGFAGGDGGSAFRFENAEGDEIPLGIESVGDEASSGSEGLPWTVLTLSSGRKDPGEGAWTLVMANPDGQENRFENALFVLDKLRPRIRHVVPGEIPAGKEHNTAFVEIAGMEEGAVVEFDGPSDIKPQLLDIDEQRTLEYSLDLLGAEPGWYSVTVTNPSGGTDTKKKALEVLPRPPTEEELWEEAALKVDGNEPRALPERNRALTFGWNMSFAVGDSTGYFDNDFIGLSAGVSQDFHNDLIRRIPWLDGLGWHVGMIYSRHRTDYPLYTLFSHRLAFEAGVHYVTPFDFPLNLLVRSGAGVAYSGYTSPEYDRHDMIFGSYTLQDLDSLDFSARIGIGGRYEISPRWFVDITLDFTGTFFLTRTAWTLQPRLEGGWRW